MVLGFISLILVFSQYYIADICIPINVADTMLPCPKKVQDKIKGEGRRLLSYERRVLAAKKEPSCKEVILASTLELSSAFSISAFQIESLIRFTLFSPSHFQLELIRQHTCTSSTSRWTLPSFVLYEMRMQKLAANCLVFICIWQLFGVTNS